MSARSCEPRSSVWRSGAPVRDATCTVGDWCTAWSDTTLRASSRRATTQATYRGLLTTHVCGTDIGKVPLDRLRATDIDSLILCMRKQGKSSATVRKVFNILRLALSGAVRDRLIARNPADDVTPPAVTRTEVKVLQPEEVRALLGALRSPYQNPARLITFLELRKGRGSGAADGARRGLRHGDSRESGRRWLASGERSS